MSARTATVFLTADPAGVKAGMSAAAAETDIASTRMGDSMDKASSKAGGLMSKLGNSMNSMGLPFGNAVSAMGTKLDETSTKGEKFGQAMSSVGKAAALGVAAGAVVVAVESVKMAQAFQQTVTSIAANANISVGAAQKIGNAFLDTAGTTIYSGKQIGDAYAGVAGQLGVMQGHALNSKQALDIMRVSMDLAEGSGTSLSGATSGLTQTLQAFQLPLKDASTASDILFSSARATGTSVDSVASSFTRLRGQLGSAAPSLGAMGGLLIDLAQHGEANSRAMRSVSTSLLGLLTPTTAVQKAQEFMGVSFKDAHGNLLPLNQIIGEVQPKIAGMGTAQAAATLKAIGFGSASGKLVSTIQAGPAAFDAATAAASRAGSAHAAAAKQSQTLQHQMETLKASFDDVATKIGQALIPKLEALMKIVAAVVQWMMKHKTIMEVLGAAILAFVATAVAAWIAGMVASAAATIAATWPILAIIAAVALVAAAIYEFVAHWSAIWNAVKGFAVSIWDAIVGFFKKWGMDILDALFPILLLVPILKTHWNQIKSDAAAVWDDIVSFFTGIPAKIIGAVTGLAEQLWTWAHNAVEQIKTGFVIAWDDVYSWVSGIPGRIIHDIGDVTSLLYNAGMAIIHSLLKGITDAFNAVKSFVSGIASTIASLKGPISYDATLLVPHGKAIMSGLAAGLKQGFDGQVAPYMSGVAGQIAGAMGTTTISPIGVGGASGGSSAPGQSGATGTAAGAGSAGASRGATNVYQTFNTPMSPSAVAQEVGWTLRTASNS